MKCDSNQANTNKMMSRKRKNECLAASHPVYLAFLGHTSIYDRILPDHGLLTATAAPALSPLAVVGGLLFCCRRPQTGSC